MGGDPPPDIDEHELINEAGHFLTTMHPWKWLEAGQVRLDLRKNRTFAGATTSITASSSKVQISAKSSSAFADYTHLEGDVLEITGGTNVTTGFYRISRIVSDQVLLLSDTPLVDDTANGTNIIGTIHAAAIALPNDFREAIAIHATDGTKNRIEFTTYNDLLQKRASNNVALDSYYAAISYATEVAPESLSTLVGPVPRMEIWPSPSSDSMGAFSMFYRAGWNVTVSEFARLKMPGYCETLYLEILRAFARSRIVLLDPAASGMDLNTSLSRIMAGPLFQTAIDRDGSIQPDYGPMHNGAASKRHYHHPFGNYNTPVS